MSAKIRKSLEEIVSFRIDGEDSANALLGSAQRQAVGSHWPINDERAQQDFLENNNGVSSTAVSGEATLVGVEHVDGADFLRIKTDLQIDGMIYPIKDPGAICDPARGKAVVTTLLPVDENHGGVEVHTSFAVTARVHVTIKGHNVIGDADIATQRDAVVTPL